MQEQGKLQRQTRKLENQFLDAAEGKNAINLGAHRSTPFSNAVKGIAQQIGRGLAGIEAPMFRRQGGAFGKTGPDAGTLGEVPGMLMKAGEQLLRASEEIGRGVPKPGPEGGALLDLSMDIKQQNSLLATMNSSLRSIANRQPKVATI